MPGRNLRTVASDDRSGVDLEVVAGVVGVLVNNAAVLLGLLDLTADAFAAIGIAAPDVTGVKADWKAFVLYIGFIGYGFNCIDNVRDKDFNSKILSGRCLVRRCEEV